MTAHLTVTTQMPAGSERVFDAIHDYDGRLAWDTLLQQAEVHGDRPGRAVVTTCTARRSLGGWRSPRSTRHSTGHAWQR
ncbi:MAG: hypothetical protein M3520_01440 [Actinomycetota bacterium]|nr:hypothetical protein [Actinomycetota bacterium]